MGFLFLLMFGIVSVFLIFTLNEIGENLRRIADILEGDIDDEVEDEKEENAKTEDSN